MTGKQSAVMWLGLLLVITRLFTTGQWHTIWGAIGTSPASTSSGSTVGKAAAAVDASNPNGVTGGIPGDIKQAMNGIIPGSGTIVPIIEKL